MNTLKGIHKAGMLFTCISFCGYLSCSFTYPLKAVRDFTMYLFWVMNNDLYPRHQSLAISIRAVNAAVPLASVAAVIDLVHDVHAG